MLVKAALNKAIGNGQLQWKEPESVLLSFETTLNDRPLRYMEEDIQTTVITPNSLLSLQPNQLSEPSHHVIATRACEKDISICRNAKCRLEPLDEGISSKSSREICEKEERKSRCACCRRGSYRPFRAEELGSVDAGIFNRVDHRKGRSHSWCKGELNPEESEFRTRPKRDAAIAASLRIGVAVDQDVFDNSVVGQVL